MTKRRKRKKPKGRSGESTKHGTLIEYYSNPENCCFLHEPVDCLLIEHQYYPENITPDIVYFLETEVVIAEIKSREHTLSTFKARTQLENYKEKLKGRYNNIRLVMILGNSVYEL